MASIAARYVAESEAAGPSIAERHGIESEPLFSLRGVSRDHAY
jgi:hypothetical protein